MRILTHLFLAILSLGMLTGVGVVIFVISYYGQGLPDYAQLKKFESPDSLPLMAEHAKEKRIFTPISMIPDQVKHAFIAAEDPDFYTHENRDPFVTLLAIIMDIRQDNRPKGASTITYQVTKNYFARAYESPHERIIREALLSFRLGNAFSKDQLLELYLNGLYLGEDCFGVADAALHYFNKSPGDLALEEVAYLAALPKGPNNYNSERHPEAAKERRDWVISRMLADNYITAGQAETAMAKPLKTTPGTSAQP